MRETELKFTVPRQNVDALRRALHADDAATEHLQATYFDTDDWRLAKRRVSLRMRREHGGWVQTAKAETGRKLKRLEQNVSVSADQEPPAPDPIRHAGHPVGDVLRKALGKKRFDSVGHSLSPRFLTDVVRTARTVRTDTAELELALDVGTIEADGRTVPVHEFEIELKAGPASAMAAIGPQWIEPYGLWLNVASKAERGAILARPGHDPQPVKAERTQVRGKPDGHAFFAVTLENCLQQVLGNASQIADGRLSDELVHQLRVGLRRLRTALRELQGLSAGVRPEWESALAKAFQELGRHRDRTVLIASVRKELASVPAPGFQDPKRAPSTREPMAVVRDASFQVTMLELVIFASEQAHADEEKASDRTRVRAFLVERLARLLGRIRRDGKRFDQLGAPAQHRVRKRLKRLRYLSEFSTPVFGAANVDRYLARWEEAQDALGAYNDQRIAIDLLSAANKDDAGAWFAIGWLQAKETESVTRCMCALHGAIDVEPFWR